MYKPMTNFLIIMSKSDSGVYLNMFTGRLSHHSQNPHPHPRPYLVQKNIQHSIISHLHNPCLYLPPWRCFRPAIRWKWIHTLPVYPGDLAVAVTSVQGTARVCVRGCVRTSRYCNSGRLCISERWPAEHKSISHNKLLMFLTTFSYLIP